MCFAHVFSKGIDARLVWFAVSISIPASIWILKHGNTFNARSKMRRFISYKLIIIFIYITVLIFNLI